METGVHGYDCECYASKLDEHLPKLSVHIKAMANKKDTKQQAASAPAKKTSGTKTTAATESKKATSKTTTPANVVESASVASKDMPTTVDSVALTAEESKVPSILIDFGSKLQQLSLSVNTLKLEYKNVVEKNILKELKQLKKQRDRKTKSKTNRSPSGFVKPTKISDELAQFLNKERGVEMARTDVTREINSYIRQNNLQDKTNGRRINADPKLTKLLKLQSSDELTYFNLQKYMSPHFYKEPKASAPAS